MSHFTVLDDKSIIKLIFIDFEPYFLYDSLIIIWGKMRVFKVLDDKSIVKLILGYFLPLFLV